MRIRKRTLHIGSCLLLDHFHIIWETELKQNTVFTTCNTTDPIAA